MYRPGIPPGSGPPTDSARNAQTPSDRISGSETQTHVGTYNPPAAPGAQAFSDIMFDAMPLACLLFQDGMPIDCNQETLRLMQVSTKEEYLSKFVQLLPPCQPDGTRSADKVRLAMEQVNLYGTHTDRWHFQRLDKTIVPVEVTLRKTKLNGADVVASYARDLTDVSEAEARGHVMLNETPLGITLWDMELHTLDCNQEMLRLLKAPGKQTLLDDFLSYAPAYQPSGQHTRQLVWEMLETCLANGSHSVHFMHADSEGNPLPTEIVLKRLVWFDGTYRILAYTRDLREVHETQAQLHEYSQLLRTINSISAALLAATPEDFHQVLVEQLGTLVRAGGFSRAYIWKNYRIRRTIYSRQVAYFSADGIDAFESAESSSFKYDDFPFITQKLLGNQIVNMCVDDLPAQERAWLSKYGARSILCIPVFFPDKLWGMLYFDNHTCAQTLTTSHERLYCACAISMASAITRDRTNRRLIRTTEHLTVRERLLSSVNEIAQLLLSNTGEHFQQTLESTLQIIGENIDMDRVTIWHMPADRQADQIACSLASWIRGAQDPFLEEDMQIHVPTYLPQWADDAPAPPPEIIDIPLDRHTPPMRALVRSKNLEAVVLLRFSLDNNFWCFITYCHSNPMHKVSPSEADILRSAGIMVASAIDRQETSVKLRRAMQEALASSKAKDDFLARMSHELRTPMNAIIGMTTVARKSNDPEKIDACLDTVVSSSRQLLGIINDVLDMSAISSGQMQLSYKEFDLPALLDAVFRAAEPAMQKKDLHFTHEIVSPFTRPLLGDADSLKTVLEKLLSNAVKFTPPNGHIRVKVRNTPPAAERSTLRIEVIDDGVGIAPDFIARIFDAFEQEDSSRTREYGGTGLGLSICKHLVERMGGSISVRSSQHEGSHFTVSIPVQWVQERDWSAHTILLAEDLEINRMIVSELLAETNAVLEYACNGQQAVDMFLSAPEKYSLILMDIQMPLLDGLSATRQIRSAPCSNAQSIPIYALTANADRECQTQCRAVGMDGCIPKPIEADLLYRALHNAFAAMG